ncbi:MAG: HAMP domain-containing sensor histidine kinase [Bacteroidota bacterium]|nr:HAMP domain-containing sensor histidine kinase [Bacteroidota bacterium]
MDIYSKKQRWKQILLLSAVLIGVGSLWYTNRLVKNIEITERQKMEVWAEAVRIVSSADLETELAFPFSVIEKNTHIPVILTDAEGEIMSHKNLDSLKAENPKYLYKQLEHARQENDSLVIDLGQGEYQLLFYRDSFLLRQLFFFPFVQLGIIILFIMVSYIAFSVSRKAEQNEVWTGLSKETAHQLGTPISSLIGWMELLKNKDLDPSVISDMQKDTSRLEKITDRFSKIGSRPAMKETDLTAILKESLEYIKNRGPYNIEYLLDLPSKPIKISLNETLFEWVIENLLKNATDAINGVGRVILHAVDIENSVIVDVEDSGKGIAKSRFRTIFKPGYTTKKRGWGLGLSLSKRIIESYHHGRIFVFSSDPNDSTIIRIILKKTADQERDTSL